MMNLIGFVGKKRTGKDTCAEYLKNHGFKQIAFADPVKEICKVAFNFSDEQLYGEEKEDIDKEWGITPRKAFQFIGTDIFREQIDKILPNIGDNFWVELMRRRLLTETNEKIVISDIRFQNEADLIKKLGGKVIKLERPSLNLIDEHKSETNIDKITGIDYTLINNSTKENLWNDLAKLIH